MWKVHEGLEGCLYLSRGRAVARWPGLEGLSLVVAPESSPGSSMNGHPHTARKCWCQGFTGSQNIQLLVEQELMTKLDGVAGFLTSLFFITDEYMGIMTLSVCWSCPSMSQE